MADFAYNASALGAGGVIKRGAVTTVIPSLASVALAPTGGEGSSVANYTSPELSFGYAETRVSGVETAPERFTTSTFVQICDLTVFGRLTIKQMGAVVTSTRGMEPEEDHAFEVQVWYEGIKVDGHPVGLEYDEEVKQCGRYADFQQLVGGASPSYELVTRLGVANDPVFAQHVSDGKAVQASVVKSLVPSGPIGPGHGHVLPIPGIGVARFGELMLKPGRRRLNLLRLQLDADLGWFFPITSAMQGDMQRMSFANEAGPGDGGSMTIASVEGNGSLLVP
jgi:hypothetical protein